MRKILFLFYCLCLLQTGNTQTIPLGLNLTPGGKVVFSEGEPNYNGNLDNPVEVSCDGAESYMEDLRNVKYNMLTIVEFPDESWVLPNRNDPSRMNDTTSYYDSENNDSYPWYFYDSTQTLYFVLDSSFVIDSVYNNEVSDSKPVQPKFNDDVVGLELTDERVAMLKQKLRNYVNDHYGKVEPYSDQNDLQIELSHEDSVVDKYAVYDYLVDKLVFYNYTDDLLTSVIGYHYDYGVEFDSLRYDAAGNMTYFSTEGIGSIRNEYYMEYNKFNQVIKVINHYSSAGNTDEESYINPDIEVVKFGYNPNGNVKSKSRYQEDGTWLKCSFKPVLVN